MNIQRLTPHNSHTSAVHCRISSFWLGKPGMPVMPVALDNPSQKKALFPHLQTLGLTFSVPGDSVFFPHRRAQKWHRPPRHHAKNAFDYGLTQNSLGDQVASHSPWETQSDPASQHHYDRRLPCSLTLRGPLPGGRKDLGRDAWTVLCLCR